MKTLRLLLTVMVPLLASLSVHAAEAGDGPDRVAEKFYAGYVAAADANKEKAWVAKTELATAKFKKDYARAMGAPDLEADPVLNAQDVPSKPFKAEKPVIDGDAATVVLTTDFGGGEKHKVTASLVKVKGSWLVNAVK